MPSWTAAPGGAPCPARAAAASSSAAAERRRSPSGPTRSASTPDQRGEEVHAGHVHADDQPDDPQRRRPSAPPAWPHVHRRHDHDADHHRVRDDDGGEARAGRRASPRPRAAPARVARRGRRPAAPVPPPRRRASSSGSGRSSSQQRRRRRRRTRRPTARSRRRAAAGRAPRPRSSPGPARLGPSTEPTVVAQTTSDSARPRCSGCGEVGRGVAGLQAAGGRRRRRGRARPAAAAATTAPRPTHRDQRARGRATA